MEEKKNNNSKSSIFLVIILILLFGFFAGVAGELWVNGFLISEVSLHSFDDLTKRLDDLTAEKNKSLKELLNEQDFSINKVIEQISPTVVKFYPSKKSDATLSAVYLDNESLGLGFVFTSDGWLVTTKSVLGDLKKNYSAGVDEQFFAVEKIIVDPLTETVFVKINATNLPVADFNTRKSLNFGQTVMVAQASAGVTRATIDDLYYAPQVKNADLIRSSESFYRYILINGEYSANALGSPVFDLEGRVIGVLIGVDGRVLPVDYFSPVMKAAVQKSEVSRNYLGVNFLDLELAPNFVSKQTSGALLYSDALHLAVTSGSPAETAGLRGGDIIVKVEDDEINKFYTLPESLQDYLAGQAINLTVIRGEQEVVVSVTLAQIK